MIHPTAIIDPGARLAPDVKVGPYSMIGPDVVIGPGCVIESHVVIKGPTSIGANNRFFQFASIGEECQDKKYHGESTRLVIGDNNIFRESVTVHRGTAQDNWETRVGSDNLVMAYAHIAHDCVIGDHCVLANSATLAGHVTVGDHAIIGGLAAIHQFCRIGSHSMIGGLAAVSMDIVAYTIANGNPARTHGINIEGLRRRGFDADVISKLREAYKLVFRSNRKLAECIDILEEGETGPELQLFVDSLKYSSRGITR
ncbi:Acyl-acyl-carrier-protein--UDP-N-acetylglucosamine O-acyltransferase [Halomonadaceae bacterium LMG 33818]|uniref:acyl-ACP--UDP-N-acetylglucosamine O-acyltransferase n=1 Tax=Cernens ardua TaxID=3402176 RepID=UPI003EDC8C5F